MLFFELPLHSHSSARYLSTLFLLSMVCHGHREQWLSASLCLLSPVALVLQDIAAKAILSSQRVPTPYLPSYLFWRRMALLGRDEL